MKTRQVYEFGPFRLDATAKVLLKDEQPLHMTRKAVETLLALVQGQGQVVTRDEILAFVWPDRIVDDANLAQNIAVVRKALSVEPGAPGYIETFPGRGYRIVGPIQEAESRGSVAGPPRHWKLALAVVLPAAVGLAFAAWHVRDILPQNQDEPRRVPVTRLAGREYQPALSPDGRRVAFVWEEGDAGSAGIWIQESGESTPRPVTPSDARYSSPAWSPDGRRLAFLRFKNNVGAVVVASLDGNQQQVIAAVFPSRHGLPQRHLDWSPDGRTLAVDDPGPDHQALGIFLVSLETGEKKRLTMPDGDIIGDLDPRFSPDGNHLSFIRAFHRAGQELFIVSLPGGQPTQLTNYGREVSGQDWLPDGRTLVFGSNHGGEYRLWRIGTHRALQHQPVRTPIYGDSPIQVSIARRSPALVYSVLQRDLHTWRLDLAAELHDGNRWKLLITSSGQDVSPQYSFQGDKIVFRSDRSGQEQLWVCDSDGRNPVQVTRGDVRPSVGRWSPDGHSIVFNDPASGGVFQARLGADGRWTVHSTGVNGYHPVFSPDGKWIYAGTASSLVRIPVAGGTVMPLAAIRGISLSISKDGRYLYFVRDPAGTALWRIGTDGGQAEPVLDGLVPYCSSCWALGARGIYYLGVTPGAPDRQVLYLHDLATGRDRRVEDYPETLSPLGSGPFSLSPDGRYLLCVRTHVANADIFRVEPFR